jgi:tetratricopeptide (TPR) repeat protein
MRWRATLTCALMLTATLAAPAAAQKLPDERDRREAVGSYRTGQQLMAEEKFAAAADNFLKAINKDPLFTLAYYSLGQAYMNLRQYPDAVKAFEGCIDASRQLYALAENNRFDVEKQRNDDIREARETVATLQRSGHTAQALRAEQHLADLEKQKTSMSSAFRPAAEVLLSLGSAQFRTGNLASAESAWKAALEVNPKFGEVHNNLAVVYMMTERFKEAEEAVRQAERAGYKVNPQLKKDLKEKSGSTK